MAISLERGICYIPRMVFYFYEEAMQPVRKISVDGLAPGSFHLSPRIGNKTPEPFKADTATEIALKFIVHPQRASFFPYANIVTHTHFDTDGLLAVFTLLYPKQAEPMRSVLIAAAESGAFSSFSSEEGVKIDLLLSELITDRSPLSSSWKNHKFPKEALYYKTILPLLPNLFQHTDEYQELWRKSFDPILTSMRLFERGTVGLEEYRQEKLSVIMDEMLPARHAVDTYCKGNLFLLIQDRKRHEGGYRYRLSYRYGAREVVRRPRIPHLAMERLAATLNQQEITTSPKPMGVWQIPPRPQADALVFADSLGQMGISRLAPDAVTSALLSHIREAREYDRIEKEGRPRIRTRREKGVTPPIDRRPSVKIITDP